MIVLIYCITIFKKQVWKEPNHHIYILDDNCFQYALTVALNYQNIEKKPLQRISKIRPFINQYDWKGINFPSHKEDWKKLESNNKSVALNILYVPYSAEKKFAYKLKHNFKRKNQVILLMITDGKNGIILLWKVCLHYLEEQHRIMLETFIA